MSEQIVGRNPVIEALRSGSRQIEKILIVQGSEHSRLRQIIDAAERKGIPYQRCPRHHLDSLQPNHQGVIAFISEFQYTELSTLLKKIENNKDVPALLIMLDQIHDPRNLGAILRTANATGTDGVLIPKNNAADITAAVHKAAAGSTEYTPITKVTNLAQTIEKLKSVGIWVVGTAEDAELPYTDADFTDPLCIVLGNEGQGIRRLVKQKCDYLVHLPMLGQIRSLNVSVTAGVLLYEVLRQRSVK
ncbi:23S rRNA (guanosine(2251)-2'-O)-methyltransferase RlmB [Candidatus Poribacteria bacterium]|nr:MAG: 23S rRNA (guanosine(2251)-2'-O)-methyltransferase RlmB [Candidatus Poribacteria bacterium]